MFKNRIICVESYDKKISFLFSESETIDLTCQAEESEGNEEAKIVDDHLSENRNELQTASLFVDKNLDIADFVVIVIYINLYGDKCM